MYQCLIGVERFHVIGIPGVPARDLTDDEAKRHGVTKSDLYRKVADPETREESTDGSNR